MLNLPVRESKSLWLRLFNQVHASGGTGVTKSYRSYGSTLSEREALGRGDVICTSGEMTLFTITAWYLLKDSAKYDMYIPDHVSGENLISPTACWTDLAQNQGRKVLTETCVLY